MSDLETRQWTQLADAIRTGKCIAFIGPGATVNYADSGRQSLFFENLAQQNPGDILAYHAEDGFLIFRDSRTRSLYDNEIRDFYRQPVANPMLEKLARLPFHAYISVTPDALLKEVFDREKYACAEQYYITKVKHPLRETPTAERPLIYNLLGSVRDPQTLITSHADLFQYMRSVFGDNNLPDELKSMFTPERLRSIVFLGFEFDKWYFQLILHLLGIRVDACWRYAVAQSLPTEDNQTLIEAEFEIRFVVQDMLGFLDKLTAQFTPEELRRPAAEMPGAVRYRRPNVMQFLVNAFSASEFEVFCMIHFHAVYREFVPEMSQTRRIALLLDHVDRNGLYAKLLEAGRTENTYQYDQCGPYDEQ